MAFIRKKLPSPNVVYTFSLQDFTGGLNNRSEVLEPNEAKSLMNVRFGDNTSIENRPGQNYYDDLQLDGEVVFIDEYKPYNDLPMFIRATEREIYVNNTLLTNIAGKPCGVTHQGKYFFCDGDKLYCYGKFDQVTSTYINVIGTPNPSYCLMTVVSPDIAAVRLNTDHTQGVLNIDYTNMQIYYVPCENEFVDTFSGANVVPDNLKYIISHQGRLFASGCAEDDDNVFITDLQHPFYYPVSLPMQVPPNSDKIRGLCVYDNSVIVGREKDMYVITGDTNIIDTGADVFALKRLNTHTGIANHDSMKVAHNYLFYLGSDGIVYSLASANNNNERVLATVNISKNLDLTKEPLNFYLYEIDYATAFFFNNEYYLSISDKVLVYSYLNQKWVISKGLDASSFYSKDNKLLIGRLDGTTSFLDENTYLDFGKPYQASFYSANLDMSDAVIYKYFREFYLVAHVFQDYPSDITVLFEIDYIDVVDRLIISNQISQFGKAIWGDSRFITRNIAESLPFIIGRRGRNIRFKLSCSYDVDGEVDFYSDLTAYTGKVDGLLVYVADEDCYYLYIDGQWLAQSLYDLEQRMKFYQINGDYEKRGKR
ncbi:hypothetical protein A7K50_03245 [Dehalobacter sp. MCB1]|uniref:hypothetical protein n=1 Tax=Dehalobacter sp. MCB1 TaxID=1844756 RepID=UPI000E6C4F7B|nr:hypothetical protein [Dehalobacter sp. MCB1]RJE47677.1 hypothetical protein A7K50_03245 [Dehalobacter sp. MCB1]